MAGGIGERLWPVSVKKKTQAISQVWVKQNDD
ncbi:hypothetical protein [Mesotoga sp. Brook.08.YT.4.2.5.4.]|nr:hypothetical protein [Mesotoga sp. Brook.08.YT.4.2.5.4.]